MRSLGDEIAVLDGIDIPPEYSRSGVIDASSGANYSGGSSYAEGLPLLPSNAGLAGTDEDIAIQYGIASGVLPPRMNVLDASSGANYSGGSSYAEGLPLLPSNAGLAADLASGAPVVISARELQQYLAALGVSIGVDGTWGAQSQEALANYVSKVEGLSLTTVRAQMREILAPFAQRQKILIMDPEFMGRIFAKMVEKVRAGGALAGLSGASDLVNAYSRSNVLDASSGANYSGGSSYAEGLPLLPSNAGLAGTDDDLVNAYSRLNVLDASSGANYSGGSSYAEGLPLLPSNAGLAGTYEGKPLEAADWYWGSTMGVDQTSYSRSNVLDASSGANYSGGSSYAEGLPLLPSNAGLAGLDAFPDFSFIKKLPAAAASTFKTVAGKQAIEKSKKDVQRLGKMLKSPAAASQYERVKQALIQCQKDLGAKRYIRQRVASSRNRAEAVNALRNAFRLR